MKNKKGFTMIEILAVITILGVIALIIIPISLGVIDYSKQNMYDNQIGEIKNAAIMYVAENSSSNEELHTVGVEHIITLQELSDLGFIDLPIKNPKSGKNFEAECLNIKITRQVNNTFKYIILSNGVCGPSLILKGDSSVTVNCAATGNYEDPGASVYGALDPLEPDVMGTPTLVLKTAGRYTLNYSYLDGQTLKVATGTRTVTIVNQNIPTIQIAGNITEMNFNVGTIFTAPTATATDVCEGTIPVNVVSTVVPTVAGVYSVVYTATNQGNKKATKTVTVTVSDEPFEPLTFGYTGAVQTTVLQPGIYKVELWGAQGGNLHCAVGGLGAYVTGNLTLTTAKTLNIYVGGQNGYNGGGAAGTGSLCENGVNGGGASDIRIGGTALANRVVVAGAGGGAGGAGSCHYNGGTGIIGAASGANGIALFTSSVAGAGDGGAAGGSGAGKGGQGGCGDQRFGGDGVNATSGSLGIGGDGGATIPAQYLDSCGPGSGGGGGGGYYGGGGGGGGGGWWGGTGGAGGGGSSWGSTTITTVEGQRSGNGSILISKP